MVSVIVCQLLIQSGTPDEMRGRVNAVDSAFIGRFERPWQFESGPTAQWFGTMPAVVRYRPLGRAVSGIAPGPRNSQIRRLNALF